MTNQRPIPTIEEIWRKYDAVEQRLTASVSERMLDLAGLRLGLRILDLAEADLNKETESLRKDGRIWLSGVTRIVVASSRNSYYGRNPERC